MRGWVCDRCGATDEGTESQREGSQPPVTWLPVYVADPARSHRRQGHLCDECVEAFDTWVTSGPGGPS